MERVRWREMDRKGEMERVRWRESERGRDGERERGGERVVTGLHCDSWAEIKPDLSSSPDTRTHRLSSPLQKYTHVYTHTHTHAHMHSPRYA